MLGANVLSTDYLLFDYITFTFALFFGWWYGIWIGLAWYTAVYEEGEGMGFIKFLRLKLAGNRQQSSMRFAPEQSWDLDDLLNSKSNVANDEEGMTPTLAVFEENTILLRDSGPVHASSLHEHGSKNLHKPSVRTAQAKKPVRKIKKPASAL